MGGILEEGDNYLCYEGPDQQYMETCVKVKSPIGSVVFKSPIVKTNTSCKTEGFTLTTPLTNPDAYYGRNNVSIYSRDAIAITQFFGRIATNGDALWSLRDFGRTF